MICPQDEKCPWYGALNGAYTGEHDTDECGRVMSETGRCRNGSCARKAYHSPYPDSTPIPSGPTLEQMDRRVGLIMPLVILALLILVTVV